MNIKETISQLEGVLYGLNPKAKSLYEAIEALKNIDEKEEDSGTKAALGSNSFKIAYDANANMRTKTLFAIRELNRFVRNREIAEFLNSLEPNISVKDFVSSLSSPLFYLKNENRIHKINTDKGNNNVYWGSAKWLKEDGTPKDEHMYIEEQKPAEIEL